MIGSTIGPYRILSEIGRGGMAVVYEAEHVRLGRKVALKLIPPGRVGDKSALARFESEARIASSLNHPNVCTIYDADTDERGTAHIAMERVHGVTLAAMLSDGPLAPRSILDVTLQAARGLEAAHRAGVLHRDIKPGNIMVTEAGLVKIMDFGLARVLEQASITEPGHVAGTAAYMSPEQARGDETDERTDIWSLGVVLYEALACERPFENRYPAALMYAIVNEEPAPIPERDDDTATALGRIAMRCLQKQAEARYPSMAALLAELERIEAGDPVVPTAPRAGGGWGRVAVWTMSVVAALLLASVVYQAGQRRPPTPGAAVQRLAVLPFSLVGGAADVEGSLSEGLLHTVTSNLIKLGRYSESLVVVPAYEILGEGVSTTRQAVDLFDVSLIVSGSVETVGNTMRLVLNLVDAASRSGINSVTIEAEQDNLLAVQDRVVRELSSLLSIELNLASERSLTAGGTQFPEAYRLYLEGEGYVQWFTDPVRVDLAIQRFEEAIEIDGLFADAVAGLAQAQWRKYDIERDPALVDRAIANAEYALSLNRNSGGVNATLGLIYRKTGRFDIAQAYYERALELEPNDAVSSVGMGINLSRLGRNEEAERYLRRAVELRPELWWTHNDLGIFYNGLQRLEDALEQFRLVAQLAPDLPWGPGNMGVVYNNLDRVDDAIDAYRAAIAVDPDEIYYSSLGGIYLFRKREYSLAVEMYEAATTIDPGDARTMSLLGDAYDYAGRVEEARRAWAESVRLADADLSVNPENVEAMIFRTFSMNALAADPDPSAIAPLEARRAQLTAGELSFVAELYEQAGLRDSALSVLNEAFGQGGKESWILSPRMDSLRADPRYNDLRALYFS